MRLKLLVFFYVFLGFNISVIWAQQEEYLYGILLDSITKEPIPFATIRVQNYAIGVISNSDGSFKIPLKFKGLSDVLELSSLGYKTKVILISESALNEINTIYLQAGIIELEEAVVQARKKRPLPAKRIVQKAIDAIPENYPLKSFSTLGYYRDYQLNNGKYNNLNEAILEVFDKGFNKPDLETTNVRLYDYQENSDFERNPIARQPYDYKEGRKIIDHAYLYNFGGNEFTILRMHNAIRNFEYKTYSFVDIFKTNFIQNHIFEKKQDTYLKDDQLYTINFSTIKPKYSAYGTLYISRKDFAIYKMEYSLYDNLKAMSADKTNKHGTNRQLIFEINTEYQRINTKMFLNYISFHNVFKLAETKFKIEEFLVDLAKRCFVVKLTGKPEPISAYKKGNYTIKYNKKKVPLSQILIGDREIYLYPLLPPEEEAAMFKAINYATSLFEGVSDLMDIKVKNIKDTEGNVLNKPSFSLFDQYREYFVQQVQPNTTGPVDSLYMKKDIPIFKGQPLAKPDDFSDFWMNTPLKTPEN